MTLLTDRFRAYLEQSRLFDFASGRQSATAVVAVSGGPDSVALLDLLAATVDVTRLELVVAHVDHGIHAASQSVAAAVKELAARYGLPFELRELQLGAAATETVARRARYTALREIQARRRARCLITAHHRDDQIETVMLRVLRGSAPAGLAGIAVRSRGGLIRPLLGFTRHELAAHARERGLPVHDDPANRDPRHLRSWLRTVLLPIVADRLGDAAAQGIARVGRYAAVERRAWDRALDALPDLAFRTGPRGFDVDRASLARHDAALAGALLRAAARRVGLVLGPERARQLVRLAAKPSGRRVSLPGGWTAECAFERLRVFHAEGRATPSSLVAARDRGQVSFGEFVVRWEPATAPAALERGGWTTWVCDAGWQLRPYRPGDRIAPLGGVGHRAVRQLFMEAHVPRAERASYPVLARGETILWVPGVCRAAADLPAPGTLAVRVDVRDCGEPGANGRA